MIGKFYDMGNWMVLNRWLRVRRPAMKKNSEVLEGGWNLRSCFSRYWTKVHEIFRRYSEPFVVFNAVSQLAISCSSPDIWPLTLPLSYKVVENSSFGPHFLGGGAYPKISSYFLSVILPTDTYPALKFRKEPFRGANISTSFLTYLTI